MKKNWSRYSLLALSFILLVILTISCVTIPEESPNPTALPNIPPPVINSFTASPETINPGESVTLSWNVSGANKVTIQPILNSADSIGTTQLSPAASTAYTLVATNEAGSVTSFVSVTVKPADNSNDQKSVGVDPVTGRNQDIGFEWEQLCISTAYQVQIAKDPGFTLIVFDSGVYAPDSSTSPAMLYAAGGILEAGHTYYWRARVRQAATGQLIHGPWSQPQSFTISAGYPVTTPYQGIQLLSPVNSCCSYPVKSVPFSWAPYKETTKYRFTLARDAGLTDIIIVAEVATTSYSYEGTLDYNTSYFWQVMALQPAPSDPSTVFSFTTEAKLLPEPKTVEASPATPIWVWAVAGIGTALIIAVIVLIFMARRSYKT
jgi:hypothetical protein